MIRNELAVILLLVFVASLAVTYLLAGWWTARWRRRALIRSLRDEAEMTSRLQGGEARERRWLARFGRKVLRRAPHDPAVRLKLVRAGWDSRTAPLTYAATRVWLAVSLTLTGIGLAYALGRSPAEIALAAGGGLALAWLVPEVVIQRRTRLRQRKIRRSLPDALDLMVVCVEAGVGLDQGILRVSDEFLGMHPELAHEFRVVNQRVNAGIPRSDALRELVARTGVSEIRSLVTTLIQSEKLGVPIARVLRVSSDDLRTRRRQSAEQAARKAPIKMVFPLILFILPALILVLLGPAVIHLFRILREYAP
jgi:tight adherence protein C